MGMSISDQFDLMVKDCISKSASQADLFSCLENACKGLSSSNVDECLKYITEYKWKCNTEKRYCTYCKGELPQEELGESHETCRIAMGDFTDTTLWKTVFQIVAGNYNNVWETEVKLMDIANRFKDVILETYRRELHNDRLGIELYMDLAEHKKQFLANYFNLDNTYHKFDKIFERYFALEKNGLPNWEQSPQDYISDFIEKGNRIAEHDIDKFDELADKIRTAGFYDLLQPSLVETTRNEMKRLINVLQSYADDLDNSIIY